MIANILKPQALEIDGATVYIKGLPGWLHQVISNQVSAAYPELRGLSEEALSAGTHDASFSALGMDLMRAAVRYGVVGWEGIKDGDGADVVPEFETVRHGMDMVQRLAQDSVIFSIEHLAQIGDRVLGLTKLQSEAKKNSGAQSAPAASAGKKGSRKGS